MNNSIPVEWGGDDHKMHFDDFTPVLRCKECGFVYAEYVFNEEGKKSFFRNYSSEVHEDSDLKCNQRVEMYKIEIEYFKKHYTLNKATRVLDIGCAEGGFLDLFSEEGCKCTGVEVGEEAYEICSKKYKTYFGNFPEINIHDNFDVIISRGTLQYFENPVNYFNKMIELLEVGGVLFFTSIPNVNSVCHNLFKDRFSMPVCSIARNGFSAKVLSEWFEARGIHLIAEHYFYEETPYASPLEDIKRVAEVIERGETMDCVSPPFWGNMMTLIFRK